MGRSPVSQTESRFPRRKTLTQERLLKTRSMFFVPLFFGSARTAFGLPARCEPTFRPGENEVHRTENAKTMLYLTVVLKLLIGMLGVLIFLRLTGKTQMAHMTPIDAVNTIILGALVGSIIYMPDVSI